MRRLIVPLLLAGALTAADSSLTPAINSFTARTYRQVVRGDANQILSPFNIATALSMALAGARGQTAQQMRSVLGFPSGSSMDSALSGVLAELNKNGNSGGNELHTANALWVQQSFAIEPAFEKTLSQNYQAPPTLLNFVGNPEGARSQINRWTEEQTKDKIKNLLPAGSVDARTRLVLTSAIYFYGKWELPFVTSRTQPAPFTLPAGGTVQTNFMNQTAHFGYAETPVGQVLEMRYAGTGIAFDVVLPKTAAGLPGVEKLLSTDNLNGWLANLVSRNVDVSLPKFRIESEFSLAQALSAMGMPDAFTNTADFSGISSKQGLAIGQVVHKAFVDVSENGTEAAAATGMTMHATAMMRPEQPVVFRADHPFLFLIRDTRSQLVLFIGRLTDPR